MKIDWNNPPANDDRPPMPAAIRRRLIWTGVAIATSFLAIAGWLPTRLRQ